MFAAAYRLQRAVVGAWALSAWLSLAAAVPATAAPKGPYPWYYEPSTPDSILARVGDRTVSLGYAQSEWDRLLPNQRPQHPNEDEQRRLFLDDLVFRHLLAIEALRDERSLTAAQQAELDHLQEELMRNRLYDRLIVDPVVVESVDMDLFVRELTKILELRAYVFPAREPAQAWSTRLASGTPVSRLESAAAEADPAALLQVDYGFVTREDMEDAVARQVFRLAPGRVSAPIELDGQWGLFQVLSERDRPAGVNLSSTEDVLAKARSYRVAEAREAFRRRWRDSLDVRYNEAAMETLTARFRTAPSRQRSDASGTPTFNVFLPLPKFQPGDSALVLATVQGEPLGALELIEYLHHLGGVNRPEIQTRDELAAVVDRVAFEDAFHERALAMRLDRDPEVLEHMQRRREGFLVEAMFADSVTNQIRMPPDTLRAYFEANRAHFETPATLQAWILVTDDEARGDSLLQVARAGADLDGLARQFSLQNDVLEHGGMVGPLRHGDNPNVDLDEAMFATPVGEFGGPILTQNGWVIFKIRERSEENVESFEDALTHVTADYRKLREEQELIRFLDRIQARVPVQTYPQNLSSLSL